MSTMEDWIAEATAELGVELDVNVTELLDLAKLVAHRVARPAAPVTAFLVGYAAAQADGGPAAVTAASRRIAALAERHPDRGTTP